jgi:hypothetical protein
VSHGDPVVDRDGVELGGEKALGFDDFLHLLADVMQVHVAGHELGKAIRDGDYGLAEVFILHPVGVPQGTGAGHQTTFGVDIGTERRHRNLLIISQVMVAFQHASAF